jgi:hypothetical protein
MPTQVGHHWVEKSRSNRLRYDLDNIVSLCYSCHSKIHNQFGNSIIGGLDVANLIIRKRGGGWHERLKKISRETIKRDVIWATENHERLTKILDS